MSPFLCSAIFLICIAFACPSARAMAKETDSSDDFFKGDCQIRLAPKFDHSVNPAEVVSELILLLSYDHPLVHNVIKRAKKVSEVDVMLHLLWGFQFPIYVNPDLKANDVQKLTVKNVLKESLEGNLLFPIRYINNCALYRASQDFKSKWGTSYHDVSELDRLLDEEMRNFILPRIVAYKQAADWETWKTLSLEHRQKVAGDFLSNLYETFRSLQQGAKAAPEVDARTAQQKIIYQMPKKSYPSDHTTTRMELPNNFDLILPSEMQQIQKVVKNFNVNGSPSFLMARDYLAQYLPLLLQRRQEAIHFQSKTAAHLPAVVQAPLPTRRWWWPFNSHPLPPTALSSSPNSFSNRMKKNENDRILEVMTTSTDPKYDDVRFPTFLTVNYTLDQLIHSLQDSIGPHQARIHEHAIHLAATKTPVAAPEEITEIAALESPISYDLIAIVSGLRTAKDLPSGKIEPRIQEIADPVTTNLQSVAKVRAYGSEIFLFLNLLTQNVSALKGKNYSNLITLLATFLTELSKQGVDTTAKKFHELSFALNSFETYEQATQLHTEQVKGETLSFIQKTRQYLQALNVYTKTLDDENLKLTALRKTEELQTVLLLTENHILATIDLRQQNQGLLYENSKQLQIHLATLTTRQALGSLSDEDVKSLTEALRHLLSALQATEPQAPQP